MMHVTFAFLDQPPWQNTHQFSAQKFGRRAEGEDDLPSSIQGQGDLKIGEDCPEEGLD